VIEAYLDALLAADCVQIVGDEFPKLDLTAQGHAVMRRQQTVQLVFPAAKPAPAASAPAIPSLTPEVVTHASVPEAVHAAPTDTPVPPYDAVLFEHLRAQRITLARAEAVPPYCICSDRTLREMATHLPTDQAALLRIHGIGSAKASKYGEIFLALIRHHLAPQAGQ
jgi:superfamily II DNA helicase RecQ